MLQNALQQNHIWVFTKIHVAILNEMHHILTTLLYISILYSKNI